MKTKVTKTSTSKDKFLGPTKGNRDRNINRSAGGGGSGESHAKNSNAGKFLGPTKGNRDLPNKRS
jgi:hypothetical protein